MRKYEARSKTGLNFPAQLPVVAKLHALEVTKRIYEQLWFPVGNLDFPPKFIEMLQSELQACEFSSVNLGVQIFLNRSRKSQRRQLWAALSPRPGGVGRKTGYLGLPTRSVL